MNVDLALALQLADAADEISLRHFRSATLGVRIKRDRSPVSEADEAIERMIRDRLAKERPDDAIVGEEFGAAEGERRWILDPIDATKNYIRGIPVFGTLIALEERGELTVGVVSAPALHKRWWAARSEGAFCNGESIRVSRVARLEEAYLSYDGLFDFEDTRLTDLGKRVARTRAFGDFWSHMLVAEGAIEIALEPPIQLWDYAPLKVIVEEAGGRFSKFARGTMSTNGLVHEAAMEVVW